MTATSSEPRVNPHHPEAVYDFHGQYSDRGRYESDAHPCGAIR